MIDLTKIVWQRCPECLEEFPSHQIERHNGICGNCYLAKEKTQRKATEKLQSEIKVKRHRWIKEKYRADTGTGTE